MTEREYFKEITKLYLSTGRPYTKEISSKLKERYFQTNYEVYNGDDTLFFKQLEKKLNWTSLSHKEKSKIWSYCFKHTNQLGLGSLAISYFKKFQNKKSHSLREDWNTLKSWCPKIENWVHGDMLAGLYCDIRSEDHEGIYPELLKWSKQKSPWKARMSILSLLYYYNPKRRAPRFDEIQQILEPHIKKDHYYLQKSVGWCLRETSKVYPSEFKNLINTHLLDISSTAFTTAMEKVPTGQKEIWKKRRKESRARNR